MRPKCEIYTPKRDDEHPSPLYIGVSPLPPPPPLPPPRAPPLHIATLHQRDNSPMSLIHLAGPGNCCYLHWIRHYIYQILAGLYQSHQLLTHFMLVQIFIGSFMFIHSAPTRASFDTRDPLQWHLVCQAFLSIAFAFRGYRVFSCDVSGNWALSSRKRFLLFRRKNRVTDHMSENRHLVPYGTLHSIYQALVQPHFNYCNIVWGNCGVTLQDKPPAKTTKQS